MKAADRKLIQEKLASLREYVAELEPHLRMSLSKFQNDKLRRRAVERLFQIIVECATDANTLVIDALNQPPVNKASDTYQVMHEMGALDDYLRIRFVEHYVPKRNFIVHMYEKIEVRDLYYSTRRLIKEVREYAFQMQRFLDAQSRNDK